MCQLAEVDLTQMLQLLHCSTVAAAFPHAAYIQQALQQVHDADRRFQLLAARLPSSTSLFLATAEPAHYLLASARSMASEALAVLAQHFTLIQAWLADNPPWRGGTLSSRPTSAAGGSFQDSLSSSVDISIISITNPMYFCDLSSVASPRQTLLPPPRPASACELGVASTGPVSSTAVLS